MFIESYFSFMAVNKDYGDLKKKMLESHLVHFIKKKIINKDTSKMPLLCKMAVKSINESPISLNVLKD